MREPPGRSQRPTPPQKRGVAADEEAPTGMIEDDAAGGVAGDVEDLELFARAREGRGAGIGDDEVFYLGSARMGGITPNIRT